MKQQPLRHSAAYLRECVDVLSADPPTARWRTRPQSHFRGKRGRIDWENWNNAFAGRMIGANASGRRRMNIGGREISLRAIVAKIGITPDADRQVHAPEGSASTSVLGAVIEEASAENGLSLADLTVLANSNDPYRFDHPARRRDAEWFVKQWRGNDAVHIRGLHYKLIGRVKKPNGQTYSGSHIDFRWLGRASLAARWLGLVGFDEFEDRRNGEPFIYRAERDTTELEVGANSSFGAEPPTIDIFDGEEGELRLFPTIVGMKAEQPFLLSIFGEKSSIRGEAEPIARELGADLYLETGEQSATHVYHIAQRADADGRDLVVACVSDCDPSGYQMAVSIARKLQALIDLYFPMLNANVIHVGLTPAQVRQYNLPSSPLNPKELRRARWRERMGVEQTEIDALLTLHPGALTGMIREALKPYYDPTLNSRVRRAERQWQADAGDKIEAQISGDPDLSGPMERAEEQASEVTARIEALNQRIEQIRDLVAEINNEADSINNDIASVDRTMSAIAQTIELEPPDIPEPELPDQPEDGANLVFSSAWGWVEATENMKARKAYEVGDGEENDDTEEEDEE